MSIKLMRMPIMYIEQRFDNSYRAAAADKIPDTPAHQI